MLDRFCFYAGVFCLTLSMLMLEVIQTRILSVMAWYYLAFFVISIAMFGMTAGSVWVYLKREQLSYDNLSQKLTFYTSAYALSVLFCLAMQLTIPLTGVFTASGVFAWAELTICVSIPFFLAGVAISLALTRSPYPIGYVYAVDLVGAAAGCLLVLVLLNYLDGPAAMLTAGTVGAFGAIFFSFSHVGEWPYIKKGFNQLFLRPVLIFIGLTILCVANTQTTKGLHPMFVKDNIERRNKNMLYEKWNSYSRVAVYNRGMRSAHLWGASAKFPDIQKEWRILNIDGAAGSPMYRFRGQSEELEFLKYDITNFAYYYKNSGKAAIIGIGGGRDILSAWYFGFRDITGIELNPINVNLLQNEKGFSDFCNVNTLPGVKLIADEARSWFARSTEQFDLIQMSMIDTWAATGAGAFSLSENGLYTVEGWNIFLNHLKPDGVLTVSRWHAPGEINETGRMIALAAAALMDQGVTEPHKHIFIASVRNKLATLVLSRSPLDASAIQKLNQAAVGLEYVIVHSPDKSSDSVVLQNILSAKNRAELDAYTATLDLNLTPPTDDKPFFFNQLPFHKPAKLFEFLMNIWEGVSQTSVQEGVVFGNLLATRTLIMIVVLSILLVLATIVIPMLPALRETPLALISGGSAYFSVIGMGFMFVEIGFLQRLNVFLGRPAYSLSIVLFALILFTGAGSFLSERYKLNTCKRFVIWSLGLFVYLITLPFWAPFLFIWLQTVDIWIKCLFAVALISPAGFMMGYAFPSGMRLVQYIDNRPTPWFWAMNGAAGVLSSTLAVVISIALGIHWNFILGAICYLMLIPISAFIGFNPESGEDYEILED